MSLPWAIHPYHFYFYFHADLIWWDGPCRQWRCPVSMLCNFPLLFLFVFRGKLHSILTGHRHCRLGLQVCCEHPECFTDLWSLNVHSPSDMFSLIFRPEQVSVQGFLLIWCGYQMTWYVFVLSAEVRTCQFFLCLQVFNPQMFFYWLLTANLQNCFTVLVVANLLISSKFSTKPSKKPLKWT